MAGTTIKDQAKVAEAFSKGFFLSMAYKKKVSLERSQRKKIASAKPAGHSGEMLCKTISSPGVSVTSGDGK